MKAIVYVLTWLAGCTVAGSLQAQAGQVQPSTAWQHLLENADYTAAIELMLRLEPEAKDPYPIRQQLARTYQRLGEFYPARYWWTRALETDSLDEAANLELGQLLEKEGDLERAAIHYGRLCAYFPDKSQYHKLLASAAIQQDLLPLAFSHYAHAMRLAPRDVEIKQALAQLFIRNEQYDDAANLLTQALAIYPDHRKMHMQLIECCYSDRYYEHAAAMLDELQTQIVFSHYLKRLHGVCYFHLGEYRRAIDILLSIGEEDNKPELTCFYIYRSFLGLDDLIMARVYLDRAILACKHPNEGKYHAYMGNLLVKSEFYRQAASSYYKAYELTGDPALLYWCGRATDAAEDFATAGRHYQHFLNAAMTAKEPGDPEMLTFSRERIEQIRTFTK